MNPDVSFAPRRAKRPISGAGARLSAVCTRLAWAAGLLLGPSALHGQASGWQSRDIGTSTAGSTGEAPGAVSLTGSGRDIWDDSDGFRYYYREVTGDFDLVVRVSSLTPTHGWAKAGIMARWNLDANTAHTTMGISAAHGTAFQWRPSPGAATQTTAPSEDGTAPRWLKLSRRNYDFGGFTSHDGVNWTFVGRYVLTTAPSVYLGLAVTSHSDGALCTAQFDQLSLTAPTAAPTDLRVTHRGPNGEVRLAWTDNSPNETGFTVEYASTEREVSFVIAGSVGPNVTQFTVSNLTEGQGYLFRVKALADSVGSYSDTTSTVTTVTPLLRPVSVAANAISLYWEEPITNRTGPGSGPYSLERSTDNITFTVVASNLTNTSYNRTDYTDRTVAPNTTYYYRVRYLDSAGNASGYGTLPGGLTTPSASAGTPPQVASFTIESSGLDSGQFQATYRLVFSEPVTGVDAADFTATHVSGEPALNRPPEIRSVSGSGTSYAILVGAHYNTTSGGRFRLDLNASGTGIVDTDGNPLTAGATGPVYSTPGGPWPIARVSPPPNGTYTAGQVLQFNVRYEVSGMVVTGSPRLPLRIGSPDADLNYATFSGMIAGSFSQVLTFRFTVPPGLRDTDGISVLSPIDLNGGTIQGSNGAPGQLTFTPPDTSGVKIESSTDTSPPTARVVYSSSSGANLSFQVYFSESIRNIDRADFTITTTGTARATLQSVSLPANPGTGEQLYTLAVTADGAGSVTLTLNTSGTGITDEAGNAFAGGVTAGGSLSATHTVSSTWQSQDIGAVGRPGSTTETSESVRLTASGADIWDNNDEFRFRYQAWTGDGELIVRVTRLDPTNGWAKAGVMFRETLDPGSRHAFMCVTPGHGTAFQYRQATGGATATSNPSGNSALPRWLKLARLRGGIYGYTSEDGIGWHPAGEYLGAMPATIYVGLAVTSHDDAQLCNADFDNVTLRVGGPSDDTPAAPSSLVATATTSSTISLRWTDNATNEEGFEIHRAVDISPGQLLAIVGPNITTFTDTGLRPATQHMYNVRAINRAGASQFSNTLYVATQPDVTPEAWTGGDVGTPTARGSHTTGPEAGRFTVSGSGDDIWNRSDEFYFLRQTRSGDCIFTARLVSLQNTDYWAKAGLMIRGGTFPGARHAMVFVIPQLDVGLQSRAATDGDTGVVMSAAGYGPIWLRLVRLGSRFEAYHSRDSSSWTSIGSTTVDLPTTVDVGLAVTSHNDGTLCTAVFDNVRIEPIASTDGSPVAPNQLAASAVSSSRIDLTWEDRAANETGYEVERSTDNTNFALVGALGPNTSGYSDTTVSPATTYYYRARTVAGTVRSAYSATATATTPSGPTPPPTWASTDIGAVALAGSTETMGNTITIRGSGADIWDNVDAFRFVHRQVTGDGVVEAQVASLQETDDWAKAGVMIRESLAPDARNVAAFVTPAHGVVAQVRTATGGSTVNTGWSWTGAPFWVRLARTGNTVSVAASPDGATWTTFAMYSIAMDATVYLGFAVTSHDNTELTTAVFSDPSIR